MVSLKYFTVQALVRNTHGSTIRKSQHKPGFLEGLQRESLFFPPKKQNRNPPKTLVLQKERKESKQQTTCQYKNLSQRGHSATLPTSHQPWRDRSMWCTLSSITVVNHGCLKVVNGVKWMIYITYFLNRKWLCLQKALNATHYCHLEDKNSIILQYLGSLYRLDVHKPWLMQFI